MVFSASRLMGARIGVACLLALAAAGCTRQPDPSGQANAVAAAPEQVTADEAPPSAAAPKAGAVDRGHRGEAAPTVKLSTLDGQPVTLASYRGKPVLVNLWATWCAPCVAEMPTLDRAAATITTVALNQGEDAARIRPFLAKTRLAHAQPLLDPGMAVSLGLQANLPTTILYDAAGKEVWRVAGGRDWSSPESAKVIGEASPA